MSDHASLELADGQKDSSMQRYVPEPPPAGSLVWHYCGADALQSILANNEFWASSVAFMNDAREVITGSEALRQRFEQVKDELPKGIVEMLSGSLLPLEAEAGPVRNLETFLLSASLDGDNLSMWRAYGSVDVAYAVGVDPNAPLAPIGRAEEMDPHPGPDYEHDRFIEADDRVMHAVSGWDAPHYSEAHWFMAVYDLARSAEIVSSTLDHIEELARTVAARAAPCSS